MARELVVKYLTGDREGREDTFRDFPLKIGRADACGLRFHPQIDTKVSAVHAEIRLGELGQFEICDLESKNGVLVDGARIDGVSRLPSHAEIEIGRGGPKIKIQFVEGGSGISFAALRKTGTLARDSRPLVSTDDAMPPYQGATPSYLAAKPKPPRDMKTIGIVAGALVLVSILLAYLALT